MIIAKKAKEQIIKSISKRKYIQKVVALIYCAISEHQFRCDVTINEYDDIDVDIHTTAICILKYFGYYRYDGYIIESTSKSASIRIKWGDS